MPFPETDHGRGPRSNASEDGRGTDIKLHTSGIFLTGLTRPGSKIKLRKMKRDLADKADDRQGEPVKGNRQGFVKPLAGKPWTLDCPSGASVLEANHFCLWRCLPGSSTSGGAFGKLDRAWIGAQC